MGTFYRGAASRRPRVRGRQGFALRDLLATICCLSMLGMLGCLWVNDARIASRQGACLSNIRQLALGVANHESATRRFPRVSDAVATLDRVPPGTYVGDATDSSGYSWLVQLLPYLEERILFDEIAEASEKLDARPFDFALSDPAGDHFPMRQISAFRCPGYSGDTVVEIGMGSEYDDLVLSGDPAISNYVAIVGTHVDSKKGILENGVVVSRCESAPDQCDGKGLRLQDVGDGISKTILICETVEPIYSAWFDGQATWVVGLNPLGAGTADADGFPAATATMIGQEGYSQTALASRWPGRVTREWGASSHHNGGVVLHAFADAHALPISPDVDPTVYYRLITRSGGEPANADEL